MKRSEYESKAADFRALLLAEAEKPEGERVWPEMDKWLSVDGVSTCTTPTCVVFGRPFPVTLYENADGVHRGMCGECHQAIVPVPVFEED